jgi:hypothetical protein
MKPELCSIGLFAVLNWVIHSNTVSDPSVALTIKLIRGMLPHLDRFRPQTARAR